jgi:two-component system, NarL family, sensor kinase
MASPGVISAIATGGLLLVYLAVLALVNIGGGSATAVALVCALPVIFIVGPARRRLQRFAARTADSADDPQAGIAAVARMLAEAADPAEVLTEATSTVTSTLDLAYASIELVVDDQPVVVAETGVACTQPESFALAYAGETVGRLLACGPDGAPLDARGVATLERVAAEAGAAAHAVVATAELEAAGRRIAAASEDERRRLRRDLHDGLGPTLAAIAIQLDVIDLDRADADATLLAIRGHAQSAVDEIRKLVYELRPPALDELGLVGAIRRQADALAPLQVSVEADRVDGLPAAVEVAAFRIVAEAVNNVARHSGARHCTVRIALNGALELEVADDGRGIRADARANVGLGSMRERAAELGGTLTISRRPGGGTRVHATIPVKERP